MWRRPKMFGEFEVSGWSSLIQIVWHLLELAGECVMLEKRAVDRYKASNRAMVEYLAPVWCWLSFNTPYPYLESGNEVRTLPLCFFGDHSS
jgi:hypothetical protein